MAAAKLILEVKPGYRELTPNTGLHVPVASANSCVFTHDAFFGGAEPAQSNKDILN
jgi:hypothetical protein